MKFSFYTYTLVKMEGLGHGGRLIHMKDRSSSKFMHPEQPCTATGDFCSAIHVELLASAHHPFRKNTLRGGTTGTGRVILQLPEV